MAHYLDPKNDFVFKRIFGRHPDLLRSFLNALLPLPPDRRIESLEYVSGEMVPDNPAKKFSIVDVRCRDNHGRQFIVEMQMEWSTAFSSRILFYASKAYVQQLQRTEKYTRLRPVYALGILNENFDHKTSEFYHRYQIANLKNTDEVIEGMELILLELQKFRPETWAERRVAVLWLRFLKEMEDGVTSVPEELLANEDIRRAVDICAESAFTEEEMILYDQYWDAIRTELSVIDASLEEGKKEGLAEGEKRGRAESLSNVVLNAARKGLSKEEIADLTGLSLEEIAAVLKAHSLLG